MARLNGDPKYPSYRDGRGMKKPVEDLLKASGDNLRNAGGFKELEQFQKYLSDYKIIVYDGLSTDRVKLSGNSVSSKKVYLLYDEKDKHYNLITNLKGAMAKKYICNACDTLYDFEHKCEKVCSLCTATPPCTKDHTKYCATCNRWFLSQNCFQNHLTLKAKGKLVCQWREVWRNCSYLVTLDTKNECFKKFCNYCYKNQPGGHFCYMAALKPSKLSDRVFYVFFDAECTQDHERHNGSFVHVSNFICAQQMCSKC